MAIVMICVSGFQFIPAAKALKLNGRGQGLEQQDYYSHPYLLPSAWFYPDLFYLEKRPTVQALNS